MEKSKKHNNKKKRQVNFVFFILQKSRFVYFKNIILKMYRENNWQDDERNEDEQLISTES